MVQSNLNQAPPQSALGSINVATTTTSAAATSNSASAFPQAQGEPTSLLASPHSTPKLVQYYQDLSRKLKASLVQGHYLKMLDFAPAAQILLTTRCGAESKPPYDGFNVAHHVGDELDQVRTNREQLYKDLGCQHLCFMEQTHSNRVCIVGSQVAGDAEDVIKIDQPIVSGLDCDGLVTAEPGVALAVMTADCLPLLLCDPQARVVAAIHCGWRGIERGIIERALQQMVRLGAKAEQVQAFMGPAIGPQSFEVGAEVALQFTDKDQLYSQAFTQEEAYVNSTNGMDMGNSKLEPVADKYLCDLYQLCRISLQKVGVSSEHISGGIFDTRLQADLFYSYRASKITGRLASIISV